jgi:hypothetical protein
MNTDQGCIYLNKNSYIFMQAPFPSRVIREPPQTHLRKRMIRIYLFRESPRYPCTQSYINSGYNSQGGKCDKGPTDLGIVSRTRCASNTPRRWKNKKNPFRGILTTSALRDGTNLWSSMVGAWVSNQEITEK